VIMPPIIGAAMRCITSLPVPSPTNSGSRPATMTATVMAFGRTRNTAPSAMALRRSSTVVSAPSSCRWRIASSR